MTHGDNNGLVLPPKVAPIQVAILPVAQHKPGVLDAAAELKNRLKTQETETRKANAKFESSVAAHEKLKKKFETERKT